MSDVDDRRRSRIAWPTRTEPTTTPAGTHDHRQSNGPLLMAFLCIALLFLANVGLIWYILARGEARDETESQIRNAIREDWCEALDGFPAENYWLDGLREKYDCGPGRPIADYPAEVQQQLNGTLPAVPPSTAPDTRIPGGSLPALPTHAP